MRRASASVASDASTEVRFDAGRGTCETRDGAGRVIERRMLPPAVGFASLPARGRIGFDGLGTADNGTIVVAGGARVRRIVVNQRGRVRVQ